MVELTKKQQEEVKKEVKRELTKEIRERIHQETVFFRTQSKQQVATAVIAAFGFLLALSWRDIIAKIVNSLSNKDFLSNYPYFADVYSITLITAISVAGIILVSRWAGKPIEPIKA